MKYKLMRSAQIPKKEKFGIELEVYPDTGGCGVVTVRTRTGHNQEFYDRESTFTYIVLEGSGTFFLDDDPVPVAKGDAISVSPQTRIYYKGDLRMILLTSPAWRPENEVETRSAIW